MFECSSYFCRDDADLILIFTFTVGVRHRALGIRLKKYYLRQTLVGVDLRREWRSVGDLQCYVSGPFWFKGRTIHHNAAATVSAFPDAERDDVTRDSKKLHRPS